MWGKGGIRHVPYHLLPVRGSEEVTTTKNKGLCSYQCHAWGTDLCSVAREGWRVGLFLWDTVKVSGHLLLFYLEK